MINLPPVEVKRVSFYDIDDEDMDYSQYECNVIFSETKMAVYIPENDIKFDMEIPCGCIIPIKLESLENHDEITTYCYIFNIKFLMTPIQANEVEKYYKCHNEEIEKKNDEIEKRIEEKCENISKLCDSLENEVHLMAYKLLKLTDDKILLNHDAVIRLQKLNSPNKVDNIKYYDEKYYSVDINYSGGNISFIEDSITNFSELLEDEYKIDSDFSRSVSWELVKKASVKFYSSKWENLHGKYLSSPLEYIKPGNIADGYIEQIISCNEINHNSDEVLALFTYHMMEKGYTNGMNYFPAYFDICKQAFKVIGGNLRKSLFKNKLKGNIEVNEVHYSIDDIDMMNGSEFEHFIGKMFSKMGYLVEVTKQSGDQGIDVVAERNGKKIGIQTKCYSNSVGNSAIQEAVAGKNYYNCDKVIVVTNNSFTNSAIELAQVNDVILWDRNILKEKISELF